MADDPRVVPLTEAALKIMVAYQYNPHFSTLDERARMETVLWLVRLDAFKALSPREYERRMMSVHHGEAPKILGGQIGETHSEILPIPMILYCPNCGQQHVDKPAPHEKDCSVSRGSSICSCSRWANPPHRSHLCAYCGIIWRPADVPTTGVQSIETRGANDTLLATAAGDH